VNLAEIEVLGAAAERIAAYQSYVEYDPANPIAWFNLAVESEAARSYDIARPAVETLRRIDGAMFGMLPQRVRELVDGAAAATADHTIDGYRIISVTSARATQILYDAIRIDGGQPVTLRRVLDLSHAGAKTAFEQALELPRIDGVARATELVEDPAWGPVLVLERIRGEPLTLESIDPEVGRRLVRAAAQILHRVHDAGCLHGDLRPESILRDFAGTEEVRLIGGRKVGTTAPVPRGRTQRAPEEIAGAPVTRAIDLYELGALLRRLTPAGTDAGIDALVERAMAADPAARPEIHAFIDQLDELLARRDLPAVLGHWKVGRSIGEGGFGRVFVADNTNIPGLRAALKVLRPFMAREPEMRQRFLQEASAANKINHPGIVRIYDGNVEPDGTCYLAMDYLRGSDLRAKLADGPLPLALLLRLFREAADALGAAHAHAIVHRDIKPANLFVETRADGDHTRILDFGIALLRDEPTKERRPYTVTGHIWGTPEYMAPEQWEMLRDLDGRCDIYSLGVVFWEALAGSAPFAATTTFEWQQAHRTVPAPPIASALRYVPAGLPALLDRMLAKRREDRCADMPEVVAAIDAILAADPDGIRAADRGYRLAEPPKATPTAATIVAKPAAPTPAAPTPAAPTPAAPTPAAPTPAAPTPAPTPAKKPPIALIVGGLVAAAAAVTAIVLATGAKSSGGATTGAKTGGTSTPAASAAPDATALPAAPPAASCADHVFLEWGPAVACPNTDPVWLYDAAAKSCTRAAFSLAQLQAELDVLRTAGAAGFADLPDGFQLAFNSDRTGVTVLDSDAQPLTDEHLYISYVPNSDARDGGVRLGTAKPAYLSRDGHWCNGTTPIAAAVHKP
jgi:serine/threonine-protein kinase